MLSNTIFIQSGQCGNQVGFEILQSLYNHFVESDDDNHVDIFFRKSLRSGKIYSRAICLDTEPKVINSCISDAKSRKEWLIDPKSVCYRHGGAGNNWALGYRMCSGEFMETAVDLVRREVEMCDLCPILLSIHSMAGGTGSGLGARMSETLRDHFGNITRANIAILPYHFSEVVVQNYNAALSLSTITSSSHGIILFENEVAQDLCKRMKGIERPSLQDINSVIASNIVPILLPKYDMNNRRFLTCSSLSDDIIHLCSHPGFRLLDIKSVPQTSEASIDFTYDSWTTLIKSLLRMQTLGLWSELGISKLLSTSFSSSSTSFSSLASSSITSTKFNLYSTLVAIMTLRGENAKEALINHRDAIQQCQRSSQDQLSLLKKQSLSSSLSSSFSQRQILTGNEGSGFPPTIFANYIPDPLKLSYSPLSCNRYEHSASLLSNSQAILPVLQRSIEKASELYNANAYLHQYSAYGVDDESFQTSFRKVGQIIENYKSLSK